MANPILPPAIAALEAEQALLGSVLLDNRLYQSAGKHVLTEHFSEAFHGFVWKLIGEALLNGLDATPVTLKPFLGDSPIGALSPYQYLLRLCSEAVGNKPAKQLARLIIDCATRNQLIVLARKIEWQAKHATPDDTALQLIETSENALFALKETIGLSDQRQSRAQAVDILLQSYQTPQCRPTIALPLAELHDVLSGDLEAGNLYGLLSSSGEGKTSLALQIMDYAAAKNHPVVFFSYDQSASQCLMQIASQRLRLSARSIRDHALSANDAKRYFATLMELRKLPLQIISCTAQNIHQIVALLRPFLRKKPPLTPLVVVDHVRKIAPTTPHAHEGRIAAEIGGAAKAIAREYGLVWLNIMQRKSLRDGRENPHPSDADLFGGEQAREDYDAILYLYHPEKYRNFRLARATTAKKREAVVAHLEKWAGKSKLGALKVRFGDPSLWHALNFHAEYTSYSSTTAGDQQLLEGMLS